MVLLFLFVDSQGQKAVKQYGPLASLSETQNVHLLTHLVLLEFDVISPCFEEESLLDDSISSSLTECDFEIALDAVQVQVLGILAAQHLDAAAPF